MTGDRPKVLVLEPGYRSYEVERVALAVLGAEVIPVGANEDALVVVRALNPSAILVRERRVDAEIMSAAPALRCVVRYGIGIDNLDLDAARDRGIYVANVPDYGAEYEVSDHAVALYLAVSRRILTRDAAVRKGAWAVGQNETIIGRRSATLGMIGFGRIARKVATKFRALGFGRILAFDPGVDAAVFEKENVIPAQPDEVCKEADVLSLHAPFLPETRHMIDRERIAMLKPTAVVINVARGGLVDEVALADALTAGRIFGAGIDVFEQEPPALDHPLLSTPNTVVSDHTAWYSEDSVNALQTRAADEVLRVLTGERPVNWVNPW
ncbi:MAG: C-terminal binding protein [Devosia sp.]